MNKKQLHKIVDTCVSACIKDGKLNDGKVKTCIQLLKKLPKESAITSLEMFKHQLKITLDKTSLVIESTVSLPAQTIQKISRSLGQDYVITNTKSILNPSILGGIRLRIGDVVIDDSVLSRINQLKERISA